MVDRIYKPLVEEARRLGLEDIEIDWTRRHAHLHASLKGERCVHYVLSKTPSCSRNLKNALAGLRRLVRRAYEAKGISLQSPLENSAAPRGRRRRVRGRHKEPNRAAPLRVDPHATPLTKLDRDPWSELRKLRELLPAAAGTAAEGSLPEDNLLFAGVAERACRNGQW